MNLEVSKQKVNINTDKFLRSLAWAQIFDRKRQVLSYAKRLGPDFYPRLHLYVDENENNYIFNLHLDQKKASYQGHSAHSGEYNSDLVARELDVIKQALISKTGNNRRGDNKEMLSEEKINDDMNLIGKGDAGEDAKRLNLKKNKKKSWLNKIFKI
jgi:hypothetical protein